MQTTFFGAIVFYIVITIIICAALILASVFFVKAIKVLKKVDRYLDIKLEEKNKQDK